MMTTETIKVDSMKGKTSATEVKASAKQRMAFVDYLRVALTMLVIAHHAAQAYGPTGGAWLVTNATTSRFLGPFFGVNAMFFMGLFFLVSGYFVPRSYDRRGAAAFLKSRFIRLGIPALFAGWFVFGSIIYLTQDVRPSFTEFVRFLYQTGWQQPYVHLWFLLHLLLYNAGYAVWRLVMERIKGRKTAVSTPHSAGISLPTHRSILVFALALALVSFVVRIWYPIDRWAPLFYLIPSEIAHLPQYVALFVLGIMANRGQWLREFPTRTGMIWLGIGLFAAAAYYVYSLWGARLFYDALGTGIIEIGGLDWRSFVFCLWEALVCVGLAAGLLVLFRDRFNKQPGALWSALIGAAYAAYIIHVLIVVGIQMGFDAVPLGPFVKPVLVTLIGIVLSFGIGHLVRKVPGAKKIL
jgi:surface polysaccharide O-acyltransferase-like enzyme